MQSVKMLLISSVGLLVAGIFLALARTAGAQAPLDSSAPLADAVLYDGSLGTLPGEQGMIFLAADTSPLGDTVEVVQSYAGDGARLDSTADYEDSAGYSHAATDLDRQQGVTIRFTVQITTEDHTSSGTADKNGDGVADRAGFSVIAISGDGQMGIELGFWEDEIWAQEGGVAPDLFTHAEGVAFDTTALITYELSLLGDRYALSAHKSTILSGTLRNYTAFSGFIDPYDTPNFLFFGDDTASASADIKLTYISVRTGSYRLHLPLLGNG